MCDECKDVILNGLGAIEAMGGWGAPAFELENV